MADALLNQVQDLFEGQIVSTSIANPLILSLTAVGQDFEGQKLVENLTTYMVSASGVGQRQM